eukprot:TRINITY_DN10411_c0_g1_i1.p1 TRINITY_DN10411_c0_g1~~TRINITY_DN10411_c0_g1_i1.p1  ORF type:complete len:156 (-),score=49.23 TRINITY_DN10411_c0_g1_i1:211-678(-)
MEDDMLSSSGLGNSEEKVLAKFSLVISKARELKAEGNQLYKREKYKEAILRYEGALEGITHELLSDLHSLDAKEPFDALVSLKKECKLNLALVFLKVERYREAAQECTDVWKGLRSRLWCRLMGSRCRRFIEEHSRTKCLRIIRKHWRTSQRRIN